MSRRRWYVLVAAVLFAPVLSTCATIELPYTDGVRLIPTDTGTTFQGSPVPVECPAGTHGGVNPHVAEFDDCQRLTVGSSSFSALIGVRALARTTGTDLSPFETPFGAAVAQLYNFSSFQFGPLRIQPKYSCVYLRRQVGNQWRGSVVAMGEDTTCPAPTGTTWTGPTFIAERDASGSANPADYPAVARWEWTPAAGNGAIGVHCGAGWCEIGPAADATPAPPGTVKGWSDEQLLAEEVPGGLVPRVRATITPVTRLDTLQLRDFTCDGPCTDSTAAWVHVATVILATPSDYYRRKMNFEPGPAGNRIYLRYKPAHPEGRRWQTRIISAAGTTSYHVTNYMPQPAAQVPPVARFRWRSDDDTTWIRCSLGCCEGTGTRIALTDL